MSLHGTVMKSAKKMKNGVREITVEKSDDNKGYIMTHHMHDYDHPQHGKKHICTSEAQMTKHMKEHMPLDGDEDEKDGEA
jgi:hypothetical protein